MAKRKKAHEPHPESPFAASDTPVDTATEPIDEPQPEAAAEAGAATETAPIATPEQVEGLAKALAAQAHDAADVEATEKRLNGIAPATPTPARLPRERELPFGTSRFNADLAIKTIADKTEEVEALKAEWDSQKSLAADAKKAYDTAVESLLKIIDRLRGQQLQQAHQPTLQEIEDGAEVPADSRAACPWEREHPGERCPVCSQAAAKAANGAGEGPSPDSPEHPQHEGHVEEVEGEVARQLVLLTQRLQPKRLHVTSTELAELDSADLQQLREYAAAEFCPVPPELLTQAHIAGAFDDDSGVAQHCTRCGMLLWNRGDVGDAYPAGDLVGLDCTEASDAYQPTDEEIAAAEDLAGKVEKDAALDDPDDEPSAAKKKARKTRAKTTH